MHMIKDGIFKKGINYERKYLDDAWNWFYCSEDWICTGCTDGLKKGEYRNESKNGYFYY